MEVLDGTSIEWRSAGSCFEGITGGPVGAWCCGAVRCGAIDRDPLDKSGRKPVRWSRDRPVVDAGRVLSRGHPPTGIPHGHWKTTTFTGALRLTGMTAPMVLDGAMNGVASLACIEQALAPTLNPGDVVIMDDLPAHKAAGVRQAIEAIGATLTYLLPYSPDSNPIEMAFAKLKSLIRAKAERAISTLWNTVGDIIGLFEPQECANDFAPAGYDTS